MVDDYVVQVHINILYEWKFLFANLPYGWSVQGNVFVMSALGLAPWKENGINLTQKIAFVGI